jgi:hypothetical protein
VTHDHDPDEADATWWEDDAEGWREWERERAATAEHERLAARAAELFRAAGRPVPAWVTEVQR